MENPKFSIIIPARNEEDYIARTIKSTRNQTYQPLETIVVANSCNDETARVARDLGVNVLETETPGISHAKNLGTSIAKGDVYVYCDSDSVMRPDLLKTITKYLEKGYTSGKARIWSLEPGLKGKLVFSYVDFTARLLANFPFFDSGFGALIFSTKSHFDGLVNKYGYGWNENTKVGEDLDFAYRSKRIGRFAYIKETGIKTSMRRYDKYGVLKCFWHDAKCFVKPEFSSRDRHQD